MKKIMMLLIIIIVGLMLTVNASTKTIVTDGLVSYWTFDRDDIVNGTVKDVWGENNAIIVGNPTIVSGRVKQALKFDGIDDYVNLTNLGNFGAKLDSSTFEAWIKTDFKDEWTTLFKVRDQGNGFVAGMGWGIDINRTLEDPRNNNFMFVPRGDPHDQLIYGKDIISIYLGSFKKI